MNLQAIAPIIEKAIKQSLAEKRYPFGHKKMGLGNKIASGTLYNSVQVNVNGVNRTMSQPIINRTNSLTGSDRDNRNTGQNRTKIEVYMAEYWQWVQSGRLPGKKGVPLGSIEKWIAERGLKGRDKKGRFTTNRSFAFAIQKNIKKFGIRPSNFLDVAFDKILNSAQINELLGDAAFEDLINAIEGL